MLVATYDCKRKGKLSHDCFHLRATRYRCSEVKRDLSLFPDANAPNRSLLTIKSWNSCEINRSWGYTCNRVTETPWEPLTLSVLQINLIRRRTPVLLQVYLPSGLFVVVSWISFIVPPEVVPGNAPGGVKNHFCYFYRVSISAWGNAVGSHYRKFCTSR